MRAQNIISKQFIIDACVSMTYRNWWDFLHESVMQPIIKEHEFEKEKKCNDI